MTFPLRIGTQRIADPPGLAMAVRADAAAGGRLVPGEKPRDWVMGLVRGRLLPEDMAVALVAALLQDPSPATLTECAHLARALNRPELGAVLLAAVDAHDVGVLLVAAPGEADRSVEDVLLLAAAALADVSSPEVRTALLERLRHAGLSSAELAVLARGGTAEEVQTWLPAVLQEDLPDGQALAALLLRSDTRAAGIAALQALDEAPRRAAYQAARAADRRIATDVRLRTQLFSTLGRS